MSVAAQCPECCECPTPTTQWDSVSAFLSKFGYAESPGFVSTPPKRYKKLTFTGTIEFRYFGEKEDWQGVFEYISASTVSETTAFGYGYYTGASPGCSFGTYVGFLDQTPGPHTNPNTVGGGCSVSSTVGGQSCDISSPTPPDKYCVNTRVATLSEEYTTADLVTNAIAALPAYPGTWSGTPGSFRNISTDELSIAIRQARYRLIFPVPLVGPGTCYRLAWVERFIAEVGVALTSAEIVTRGVYRPSISSSGGGGTGLVLVAIMSSAGAISSIRILNPGSGYTSAPTITVQSATGGGTTSTGWTATVTDGQVTAVAGGSGGDYLPTGAFSGGGTGTGATITFTMDETGGLATCPLGSGGSGYTSAPTLTITPKVSGPLAARVDLHLGTETARCAVWDGIAPDDYDPEDPATWPIIGDGTNPYFELPVPSADGTTLVANLRAYCDCSDCP